VVFVRPREAQLKSVTRDPVFTILHERSEQEQGYLQMEQLLERAHAYLNALEADRQAALARSEQKAEEAKLIKARQEGFRAAVEILGGELRAAKIGSLNDPKEPVRRRRPRRHIPELIERELSFSGQAMTTRQIAEAIDYTLERTEIALERMRETGQVFRSGKNKWVIDTISFTHMNGDAIGAGNVKSRQPPDA